MPRHILAVDDEVHIRRLIEYSAVDTVRPPDSEGYGEVTAAALPAALADFSVLGDNGPIGPVGPVGNKKTVEYS